MKCLTASPKSLSQEELDMLRSAFEMYTEACRDNGMEMFSEIYIKLVLSPFLVKEKCESLKI